MMNLALKIAVLLFSCISNFWPFLTSIDKMTFMGNSSWNYTNLTKSDTIQGIIPADVITENIRIMMTSLYAISFLAALVGNSLGVYIICWKCGTIKAATNLLIANLAFSNLLITLIVMPMSVTFLYIGFRWHSGIAGTITCKFTQYLFLFPIAASILTILVVSIDRFFAVFYPLKGQVFRRPKTMTASIWICSAMLMSPALAIFQVVSDGKGSWSCVLYFGENQQRADTLFKVYYSLIFVALYLLPLLIISVLYSLVCYKLYIRRLPGNTRAQTYKVAVEKAKRKVIKVLVMIVAVFALCWFPAHAMHYLIAFDRDFYSKIPSYLFPLFLWISHSNSAIDPCLYILLSHNFRREFRKVINQCGLYKKKKSFHRRLSKFSINLSKRNWDTRRISSRKSGSNFWSFRRTDLYRAELDEERNGKYNIQHLNAANKKPVAEELLRAAPLGDHVL